MESRKGIISKKGSYNAIEWEERMIHFEMQDNLPVTKIAITGGFNEDVRQIYGDEGGIETWVVSAQMTRNQRRDSSCE